MKKFSSILIILFSCFLFTLEIKADDSMKLDWQKQGLEAHFYSVTEVENKNFIAVGYSLSSSDLGAEMPNLGELDSVIVKYNSTGDVVWQKKWGGNKNDFFWGITFVSDGYIAVGLTQSTDISGINLNGDPQAAVLIKYDLQGNVLWQKTWGGSKEDKFESVVKTSDGGFVAVGFSGSSDIPNLNNSGGQDAIIVKFNSLGEVEWQNMCGTESNENFKSVVQVSDGYVAAGYYNGELSEGWVVKFGLDGSLVWQKYFPDYSEFNSLINIIDNQYIVSGGAERSINSTMTGELFYGALIKYDSNGDIISKQGFDGEGHMKITTLKNQEYLTIIDTKHTSAEGITIQGESDIIMRKYSNLDELLWQSSWGGNGIENIPIATSTSDGGFILIVNTNSTDITNITLSSNFATAVIKYSPTVPLPISYGVTIKSSIKGTILSDKSSLVSGETVTLSITPDNGYKLKSIKVLKSSDESDATSLVNYNSVDKTFVMPPYDVTIEAIFEEEIVNPKTGVVNLTFICIVAVFLGIGIYYVTKKKQKFI